MRIPSIILVAGLLMGAAAVAGADDSHLSSVTVSPQVGTLTYGGGGTVTYTVTLTRRSGASGAFSAVLSQTASLPAGAAVVSFVPSTVAFATGDVTKTSTLTMSTTGSTRAGSTTIKVKAKESDNSVTGNGTLAVGKAPLTVTANDDSRIYNGQTYTGGNGVTYNGFVNGETPAVLGGTLTYNAHGAKNAGSYAITPGGLTSSNYAITFVNGTLTIDSAAATVKANNKSKTYGSANPTLDATVAGEVPGGDHINYTLATTATQFSSVAGSPYPITVTLGVNPNYSVKIPADNGALTILARAATVRANNKSKTYGDLNPALDATVTGEVAGGDAILYTLATGATQFSNVTGSPYAITVALGANPNYSVTPTDGTLTINTAVATVTANSKSKTYGEANPALDATVTGQVAGGALLNYTLSTPATQFSNVSGSPYAIAVALGANPNYSVTSANGTLAIARAIATVTANNKTKGYGATNPPLDAAVTGQVPGGDVIAYTLTTTATQFSNVADAPFPIAVNLGANPNYSITPANGTLAISAAIATVRANNKSKTYGDLNPALDATVTGAVPGGDAINYSLTTTVTQFSGAVGSPYTIAVTLGANPNYSVTPINGTLGINPAIATVVANNKTKFYGVPNPTLDATVTGQVPGGDVINYALSTPATQFTNVLGGPYAIIVTLGANPNYSVTPTNGTLTINPAPASVIAINKTKAYGDPNPALEATVTGQVAGGAVIVYTLATTATQLSNVGTYPITVVLGANPNYNIVGTNGALTVQPKTATVRANDKAKFYGQLNPTLDATVGGQVAGGDAVNYTLTTTATQFSGVGGYTITVTLGANPNYSVLTANGTLAISAAVATVQANNKSKTYGQTNPPLDATVTGQVPGGDVINYTLATPAAQYSNVAGSPYPITVTLGANPNYSITPTNSTLTINPAIATVTADNKTKTYGEPNPTLTATVTGEVTGSDAFNRSSLASAGVVGGGDPINYTLSTTATQFSNVAGSPYAITVALGSNPNYTITPTNGTLTINPAVATVKANSQTKTYGSPNPTPVATVTGQVTGGDPIMYTLAHTATQFSNVVGSPYAINVTLGSNPNYSVKVPADNGTLTINPALATVKANDKTKDYGAPIPTLDATVTGQVTGGDLINYTLTTPATSLSNVAGSPYAINVTLGANPNYSVTITSGALMITPAFATVKANSQTKTYGSANPVPVATVTGQVTGGDPISYTLAHTATQFSPVAGSPYAINVTLGANPNYSVKVPADNGTLTINPAPATVTANNKSKTYGADNPALDATVTGAVAGGDAINYSLATAVTKCSPVAGNPYAIIVTLGVNPNYNATAVNGSLTIDPAIVLVKANCKTKTYGSPNPLLDATVTGQVPGCDPVLYTLGTAATQFSNVSGSPYAITVTLGSNPNYSVKVPADNCALTITPALATVTANDKTKIYGAVVTTLDAVVTGQVTGGDPINYTLTSPVTQFSNVAGSPYPITVILGANPNYSVVATNGTYTVNAALASVIATNMTKTYGAPVAPLIATVTGEVTGGDPILYTVTSPVTQFSNVSGSPYPITVNLGTNPNYSVVATNGTFSINAAIASVKANNQTKTYGSVNPTPTATVTGEVAGGDRINYTLAHTATQFSEVAGSPYPITVTLGANPNYSVKVPADNGTLTITPAPVTVTANDRAKNYGSPNPPLDATVVGTVPGGAPLIYNLATAVVDCSPVAGSPYPITITLGANPNYSVTPINGRLTIDPAIVTVRANNKSRSYGGANPPLVAVVLGQVPGCDPVNFTLATAATQCSPVAGSPYPITVTLGFNPNYSVKVPADNGTLTIQPAPATVTANNKTKTYGNPNPPLDATVLGQVTGCDPIIYTLTTTATQFSNVAGGPYAITVALGLNPNYNITVINGTLTLTPATATVTGRNLTKIYGDPNPTLTVTVTGQVMGGDPISYTLATTAAECSPVGVHPYTITLGANPNYIVTLVSGTLTILPRPVTVVANNKTKLYGSTNPPLDATVTNAAVGCDPVLYTLSTTATPFSNVLEGPYPITVNLGPNPNYTITPTNGLLTVQPALATLIIISRTKTYGDPNPLLEAEASGEVTVRDAVKYSLAAVGAAGGGDPINYTVTTTATQCSPLSGNPYPITAVLGPNPNYTITVVNGTLTILPRPATVKANDKTRTYGDPNPSLDATVTNAAVGCDPVDYDLTTTATQLSSVMGGPYAIAVTLGPNPNYSITTTNGTLALQTRPVTVTASTRAKVYGDPDPALTYTITSGSLAGTDAFSGELTRVAGQSVAGPYAINKGTLSLGDNYALTYVGANLAITPATLAVAAGHQSKVYGNSDPPLSYTVTGFKFTDDAAGVLTGGLTRATGQTVAGSPYAILRGTLSSNSNYAIGFTGNSLEITARPVTITANARTKTFGSSDPALTYAITDGSLAFTDAFTGALDRAFGESVAGGPYSILQGALALNSNYALSYVGASLTISPAQAATSIAFAPNPQQYSDFVDLTATVTNGFLGGEKALEAVTVRIGAHVLGTIPLSPSGSNLSGTLSVPLLEPAPNGTGPRAPGSYAVTSGEPLANPNFAVTPFVPAALTIGPEDARATYTGAISATTTGSSDDHSSAVISSSSSSTSRKATVTLSATIRDITATSDAAGDASAGDIRNATVTFVNRDNGNAVIATVPIGLVSTGETMTGTATYDWPVDIGSVSTKQFRVGIVVNNYYARNSLDDNAVVTVSKAPSGTVTGSGFLVLSSSAGILAGGTGTNNDFSFNLQRSSSGSLQGSITTTVRSGGRVYRVDGSSMTSLAVQPATVGGTATLNGKATIKDITNAGATIVIDNNATLQVTMADLGSPGTADQIGITVWKKQGGLWFTSNWNGVQTVEQVLASGNVSVSGSSGGGAAQPTSASAGPLDPVAPLSNTAVPLSYAFPQNFPNPFSASTTLRFELPEPSRVTLTIYDVTGREVANLVDEAVDPGVHVRTWSGRNRDGVPASAGVYFARIVATSLRGSGGLRSDRRIILVK